MEEVKGGILMALPAEIRRKVYRHLIVSTEPILIRKPRARTFKELAFSSARSSILYVNKQIHCEAIRVFFTYNTFAVGNGADEGEASLAGLRAFVKYMPAELIALISRLQFNVYLRKIQDPSSPSLNTPRFRPNSPESDSAPATPEAQLELQFSAYEAVPFNSGHRRSLGSPAEAAGIRQIHQMIPQHFPGLTAITLDWVPSSYRMIELWPGRILPKESIITVISSAVATILTLPKLRDLSIWEDECVFTGSILERTLIVGAEMGKAVDFEYLRYSEGASGRIRGGDKEQREIRMWW
jgi:hypothetical protein